MHHAKLVEPDGRPAAPVRTAPVDDRISSLRRHPETVGLVLLALALIFNALLLAPETRIERVPVNDLAFHLEASQRLGDGIARGEPFMDPWVSQWSLGYPLWSIYQPLPHLLAAAVITLARPFASPAQIFATLYYLLLVMLPLSVYIGARLMGFTPMAAGLASILILAPSEAGDFSRYGLGYGAYVWRGSGLYTELVAFELLLPALGLMARAIDSGKKETTAAIALALTALSHIFFGYVAFVSMAVWALTGPGEGRAQRLARAASITARAILLLAWFVVPMILGGAEVNRSRWDPAYKFDSYGAPIILTELFSGRMLDFGRWPVLSLMAAAGAATAAFNISDTLARRLLVLTGVWLLLYFGRATWGHLLVVAGIPSQFHLHRLEAAFELFAVLLCAWGLERIITAMLRGPRFSTIGLVAVLCGALVMIGLERAQYLSFNTRWGEANLAAFNHDRGDLELALADVRSILAERPGRVSAGKAADWGGTFKIGSAHVYSFLTREGLDEASFLYHTISRSSDFMVLRDENDPAHENLFGIRAVLAPATLKMPVYLNKRGEHGRFAVYEASPEGYFSLVDIGARYEGATATWYEPVSTWLRSPMLRAGEVVALDSRAVAAPAMSRWDPVPAPASNFKSPRGRIVPESRIGEEYRASIDVNRPCYALIKITYHPGLVARVDGYPAPILRVSPDFGAIGLLPGHHEVEVHYQPGPLKPLLFVLGLALFVLAARQPSFAGAWRRGERWLGGRIAVLGGWLATDRIKVAIALALLILLFTRALFRGQLVDGHDARTYPPRLTEFAKVLADGQLPPVWAPDLSNGHGQPEFEFAPPLPYVMALPLFKCGLNLADSLQFGLAILLAAGATAVYLIGRQMSFSRIASIGGAAAWLFAPYLALSTYVTFRMAECSASAIAPVAVLGLLMVLDQPGAMSVVVSAVAISLLPLAHNAIALLMFPILGAIVIARSIISDARLRTATAGAAAIAGGLGLSAFFWLPALLEKDFVKTGLLLTDYLNWTLHILRPSQLLWGRWGFDYAVAFGGPYVTISFSLGLFHIALAIAGLVIGLRTLNRTRRLDAFLFGAAALAGAFMSVRWSSLVWRHAPILQYLQFPWRMEAICALFMPLLALYAFERIGPKASVFVIVLMVLWNLHHTQPKGYLSYDEEFYYPDSIAQHGLVTTLRNEYEPEGVHSRMAYTGNGFLNSPLWESVRESNWTSTSHEYAVVVKAPFVATDTTDYYPGWTVTIDGHKTGITSEPVSGLISFKVPAGPHDIKVELHQTPIRRIAALISVFTLGLMLLGAATAGLVRSLRQCGTGANAWATATSAQLTAATGLILLLIVGDFILATPPLIGDPNGKLVGFFAGAVMLGVIFEALVPYLQPLIRTPKSGIITSVITLTILALVKIVLVHHFAGFEVDTRLYTSWAERIATLGPAHTFEPGYFLDYPPGYLYALWIAGLIAHGFGASGALFRTIVESPPIFADFALAALVFALVRRQRSCAIAFVAMLTVALNPALLYDTVVWGQSDSVLAFTMLLSIVALLSDQYELCFAIAAISVLVKPQGLMLLPVLGLWTLRNADYRVWIRCAIAFLATGLIVIAPFQIGHPWNWIIELYSSTAAYYHETSVNAFNLLGLLGGLRMPDSNTIAGISYYGLGMSLLVPLYAFAAWIVWSDRSPRALLFASFITIFGFFVLAPRMHERYIYPAIALAAPLALEAPLMTAVFAIVSSTGLINIAYVLHTLQSPIHPPGAVAALDPHDSLAMAVSVSNLVVLTIVLYYGATARPASSSGGRTRPSAV